MFYINKRSLVYVGLGAALLVIPPAQILADENDGIHEIFQAKKGKLVNGRVFDASNEPLPGVNVRIKAGKTGVITDIDGNFFIEVPNDEAVLVFSYVGFEEQEIKVGKSININVNLQEVSTGLNEVVVVGYGTQKKVSVIGSISTIEPASLTQGTSRAVSNRLAGQLAGVIAVQRSGEPGADGSNFWIRGISTFQGAGRDPLVLVDGVERGLDDIDASEIESFSVLKDASASAIYGVRGANGVILVNTKRGKMGKPTVNIHFEQAFTQPVKLPDYVGSADYLTLLDELRADAGFETGFYGTELIDKYRTGEDLDLYPSVDWIDVITKDHASNQRVNATISGGTETLRYAFVASYYGENGIFERDKTKEWNSGTRLNKYNIRSNVDINVTKTTLVRVNIGGYLQEGRGNPSGSDDLFKGAFETPPYMFPARYSSGEFARGPGLGNPYVSVTQGGFKTYSRSKIESLFSVEQDLKFLLPGLKIKGLFSFDRYSSSSMSRTGGPTIYNPATGRDEEGNLIMSVASTGSEYLGHSTGSEWGNKTTYFEASLNYSQDFGKHHVDGLFLYNQRDYQDGAIVPYRRQGFAGRASYMYDGRYIAEFNFGYNGSENFAKGFRFGFFPSAAVGYLLSEENFMSPYKKVFNKIKLKASWGLVGNDQLSGRRFAYITTVGGGDGYNFGVTGNRGLGGKREGDFGIPNLTWETVAKTNIGLELGLWNMFDLSVDVFQEKRRDIFMQRNTIPTTAGFINTPWANFGKVDNKGIDLSLIFNKQVTKDWFLSARGTFTYAKNEIIEKDEAAGILGTHRAETGHPVGQLFGLVDDGLFTEDDFVNVEEGTLKEGIPAHTFTSQVRPGDIKYKDLDGDGAITLMDRTAIGGTVDPQLVYGFGLNSTYKNFDINVFFQGNGRTYRILGGSSYFLPGSGVGTIGNIFANYQDRWTEDNPRQDGFYPRLSYGENLNNSQQSTWWLRNMSMLRLKDVELGYTLPRTFTNKFGLTNLRVYVKGSNLLTFSKFDLWDPEIDTNYGNRYPIMKSFSFGLDINF